MTTGLVMATGVVVSYLAGAIPFAWLGGKLLGLDIRKVGSGNIGATNLARALGGGRRGAVAFVSASLLDVGKGFAATFWLADWACTWAGTDAGNEVWFRLAFGLAAILGHVFPITLGFRGGKAVNTSLGVALALAWGPALIALGTWIVVFAIWRYVSLGSLAAAVVFPAALLLLPGYSWGEDAPLYVFCFAVSALIVVRHISNIKRLIAGTEKRIGGGKKTECGTPTS